MLSKKSIGYNRVALRFCSAAAFFLFQFDKNGWLRVSRDFWKVFVHWLWSVISVAFTVYVLVRLYQAMQTGAKGLRRVLTAAPIVWVLCPTIILSVYAEDPLAQHTIYAGMPAEYQTEEVLLLCALLEYALQCFLCTQFYFGLFAIITFFQMLQREYEEGMRELK